jgi:phosphotransferase system  glucose/maltose/N-acetylglucosamine-specific IIC component
MSSALPGDKKGGLAGLILGGIALFIVIYGIVHMTNVMYAKPEGSKSHAAAQK